MENSGEVILGLKERQEANLLLDFNRPIDAMRLFMRSVDVSKGSADSYNELGLVYALRYKNREEALLQYKKALEKEEAYYIYFAQGLAYYEEGRYEEALESFRDSMMHAEDTFFTCSAYIHIAKIYGIIGNSSSDLLEDTYTEAIAIMDKNYLPYYERALLYTSLGKWHKALADVSKALQYNTSFVKGYYLRSYIAVQIGEWNNAYTDAVSAVEYSENRSMYIVWCTQLHSVLEHYTCYQEGRSYIEFLDALLVIGASETLQDIIQDSYAVSTIAKHSPASIAYCKGILAEDAQKYQEALGYYQQARELKNDVSITLRMIGIYSILEDTKNIKILYKDLYTQAMEEDTCVEASQYAECIAEIYIGEENFEEALPWLQKAIEHSTVVIPRCLYTQIYCLYKCGLISEALSSIKDLRKHILRDNTIFHGCIEILYELRAYRECLLWCKCWKEYNSSTYMVYYYESLVHSAKGDFTEASSAVNIAIELFPSSEVIQETKVWISQNNT